MERKNRESTESDSSDSSENFAPLKNIASKGPSERIPNGK